MNARFWTWHNSGWVKLTLRPYQELSAHWYRCTDEGYAFHGTTWTHDGAGVERAITTESRDCDGRLDRQWDDYCSLGALAACDMSAPDCPENDGIMAPAWEERSASQRDYAAEAAGY